MKLFRQRWVRLLALLGVLLHGYALASHHSRAMAAAFAQASASPGAIVICRADGATDTITFDALLNGNAAKPSKSANCPICSGAISAFAIDPPAPVVLAHLPRVVERPAIVENAPLPVARAARPPATGPPAQV